jgi:hypothetical protein
MMSDKSAATSDAVVHSKQRAKALVATFLEGDELNKIELGIVLQYINSNLDRDDLLAWAREGQL